ncbi:MAG: hypothetical protein ACRC7O_17570 [Fimbriiglobus sp.]
MTLPPSARRLVALSFCLAVGCAPAENIRTYTVPKATAPAVEKPTLPGMPAPVAGGPVRLLGAIVPVGGSSRFVKFSGPDARITPHESAFDGFVKSLTVPAAANGELGFTPPAGATQVAGKMMRQTTFQFGPPGETVDLYISDPFGGSLLENVNRWRGEAGLDPVTEAELPTVTSELNLGGTKAFKVDFRGPGGKGGMMTPPFAGK